MIWNEVKDYLFIALGLFIYTIAFTVFLMPYQIDGGSDSKVSAYNVGDLGLIPGSGRSPGEGNDNPLQYSCLENPMDRGAR